MTNEQINKAVAEELGWTEIRNEPYVWYPIQTGIAPGDSESSRKKIPSFTDDHNAADEMRNGIKAEEEKLYVEWLLSIVPYLGRCAPWRTINATPRQQAEAFLRMRGKWRE